ncbi:hypothetical protein J0S82_016845, partial [Galemys pyrenaicus]
MHTWNVITLNSMYLPISKRLHFKNITFRVIRENFISSVKGENCSATTPFQFRASPIEESLTMEDEGNLTY